MYADRFKILFLFIALLISGRNSIKADTANISTLKNLNILINKELKQLRKDIRRSIYIIKSSRPASNLPELKFYKYRVKKDETFWIILARTSLDMDTLISLNSLSGPGDIYTGKIIYIPNMRGILLKNKKSINKILQKNRIKPLYVNYVNKTENFNKNYLFVPCGKLSNLERSLFLGTGFLYPLKKGRTTSTFGRRRNPFNRKKVQFHSGLDIACRINSRVFSSRSGRVVFSGFKKGYGKLIIIKHEHGYHTYYGHLNRPLVKKGQKVNTGEFIAYSGNTGRTTGPHLHFEIRKSGKPVNPAILLRK